VLFTPYPNIIHILTLEESGIEGVTDMRGKRISLGAAGSGTAVAAENVLTGLGIELSDIAPAWLSFGETTSALKDGTIDAGFVVGGLGLAAVTELAVTRDLRLVGLSDEEIARIGSHFPAYTGYSIPVGTYSGIDGDVQTLGIWSVVVVHADTPRALAYELTCTIYRHKDELLRVSEVARSMTIENIHRLPAVPLHAGAQAFVDSPTESCRLPHD
jgi:TRAP transporter TAXI family solute receptor